MLLVGSWGGGGPDSYDGDGGPDPYDGGGGSDPNGDSFIMLSSQAAPEEGDSFIMPAPKVLRTSQNRNSAGGPSDAGLDLTVLGREGSNLQPPG